MSAVLGISSYSGSMQPVRKYFNQYGNCCAFAPANWAITGTTREDTALDMLSSDGKIYAGYLIVGV